MSTKSLIVLVSVLYCLGFSSAWSEEDREYLSQRQNMMKEILIDVQLTSAEIGRDQLDKKVIQVMGEIPRHRFVPSHQREHAYENRPLPIGHGQTISQPYIVALMTDLLRPDENDIALEIGTGSGYQAAVLAGLVKHVYTIEIIKPLGTAVKERLTALDYDNITTRIGDGYYGWQEHAPFDLIIVTAASGSIPPPLIQQLKPGGHMVIPIGGIFLTQQLMLVEKDMEGGVKTRQILPVRFVPLTRSRTVD
jgi:protein-L-isoaspartate(D-aspartate) O-methyltransferase